MQEQKSTSAVYHRGKKKWMEEMYRGDFSCVDIVLINCVVVNWSKRLCRVKEDAGRRNVPEYDIKDFETGLLAFHVSVYITSSLSFFGGGCGEAGQLCYP